MKLATSNADYEKIGDEIHRLRDQKEKRQVENASRDELKNRMIEKGTIYEDKFTVEFKSGLTVDVMNKPENKRGTLRK